MMQELNYIRCGDYYIPDIRLPEENRPIGRWGRMHRDYIKEQKPFMIMSASSAIFFTLTICYSHFLDWSQKCLWIDRTDLCSKARCQSFPPGAGTERF